MANYFQGYKGRMVIDGYAPDVFKVNRWQYVSDKSLVDITNSLSFGKDQFIKNLTSGTITAEGYMTETLVTQVFDPNGASPLEQGQEVVFDLYFDYIANTKIGFENIDAIIDEFDFAVDNAGTGTFRIRALLNEPKI